jgi:hypothetical protein
MKSYRFEILPKGILLVVPWLFKIKILKELTYIIIYPFVFVKSKRLKETDNFDLYTNQMMIMVRQAEEIFLVSSVIFVVLAWIDNFSMFSFLAYLIYPLIYIWFFRQFKKKLTTSRGFARHDSNFYLSWFLTDTPLFTEAYANCNFPGYLEKRKLFAWLKYL